MRIKDNTKEQTIIQTALTMIEQAGLAGLKMSDLAKRAGVATGTLYIYYQSKDVIVSRLYTHVFSQMSVDLTKGIPPDASVKVQAKQVCRNYLDELILHPEYKAFIEQYLRSPYRSMFDAEFVPISGYLDAVAQIVQQGQAQQIIDSSFDPDLVIGLCRGALENFSQQLYNDNEKTYTEAKFNTVFDFIWNGITIH